MTVVKFVNYGCWGRGTCLSVWPLCVKHRINKLVVFPVFNWLKVFNNRSLRTTMAQAYNEHNSISTVLTWLKVLTNTSVWPLLYVCVYIYNEIYVICIHVYTHTGVCIYIYIHMHMHIHYIYMYRYLSLCTHIHTYIYIYMYRERERERGRERVKHIQTSAMPTDSTSFGDDKADDYYSYLYYK